MVLPRTMMFARQMREVNKAWKRLKVKGVGKTIAGAKINMESKQSIYEKISKVCIN